MADLPLAQPLTLVFDWGNTLMKEFPEYDGPMADWPQVVEVDGVVEALEALMLGRHPMLVATNAKASTAEQVWKALRRVGLGEYFRAVFTPGELDARKPEVAFFRGIQSVADFPAHAMVMVGDDYAADILGAKTAGWRAIWYNPQKRPAPGLIPMQDAEIYAMRDLPQAVQRLALPDYATCLAWLLERGTPHNILAHIHLVAASAYLLAVWLRNADEDVDPLLTQRGAMLHDLAKIDSIGPGKHIDHAAMARDILLSRGQPALAEIANRHMPYRERGDPRRPQTWEQKLVHYSDKLAEGNRLVPIEERLLALKKRYPQAAQELEDSWPILSELQQDISARLETTPQALFEKLRQGLGYH